MASNKRKRVVPHRVEMEDLAPDPVAGVSSSVGEVMADLEARGVVGLHADELAVYRLVMSPAEFKRLTHRLDAAFADFARASCAPAPVVQELPFGTDIDDTWRRERLDAWRSRPNGEALPSAWVVHDEFAVPGRLRLVAGREFSAWGFRGRLLFRHAITTTSGDCWVDGWDEDGACRSIRPERIRTVHRKALRASLRERMS